MGTRNGRSESQARLEAGCDASLLRVRDHSSIEELLHFIDTGVDDETERFVASIYEDRRGKMGS